MRPEGRLLHTLTESRGRVKKIEAGIMKKRDAGVYTKDTKKAPERSQEPRQRRP